MKKLTASMIIILLCMHVRAQQAFTNYGNLQIHSGTTLTGFGAFSNQSTAAWVNNGTFRLRGNITNAQSSMMNSTGTLHLEGSASQTVNGTQVFRTNHLVTNNSNGITLNNSLSVAGTHTFTAGIITSSSTPDYLVYEAGAGYSGSSDARHVNGWVTKQGNTNFIFPVGNGTYLRPIEISSLSASSVFNAKHSGATTNTANVASPIVMVDPNEYWTLNQISGGTAQVQLNWDHSKIAFPNWLLSDIRVVTYTAGMWTNRGGTATGDTRATGSITSSSINTFGAITFGSQSAILPMRLLSITAKRVNEHTAVNWTTDNEQHVDHYEVERMDDYGIKFFFIGSVPAKNSAAANTYEFIDRLPLNGTAQYRVKTVDTDGAKSYSPIVSVTGSDMRANMLLLNNPVKDALHIEVAPRHEGKYFYQIINAAGQSVQAGTLIVQGAGVVNIPVPGIRKGVHVLKISNETYHYSVKMIVQ